VFVKLIGEAEFADRALTLRYRFVHILYQNTLYSLQPTRAPRSAGRWPRRSCGTRAASWRRRR
jgi:hypothetical protein